MTLKKGYSFFKSPKRIFEKARRIYIETEPKKRLIIFCLALLAFFFYKFVQMNDNSLRRTRFAFDFNEDFVADNLQIHLYHNDFESGKDMVVITGKIIAKNEPFTDSIISVKVNENWQCLEKNSDIVMKKNVSFEEIEYFIKVEHQRDLIYLRFEGDIFNIKNQEINNVFDLSISLKNPHDSLLYPDARLEITGLYNYNLTSVFPEVTDKKEAPNSIAFESEPSYDKEQTIFRYDGIWVSGEHKLRKYQNQNWIFVYGLIIGALFSAIIEILISIKKEQR